MQGGGGGEDEEVNIQELATNLSTYKDQLQQVRQLLEDDPENSEYVDMEKELRESRIDQITLDTVFWMSTLGSQCNNFPSCFFLPSFGSTQHVPQTSKIRGSLCVGMVWLHLSPLISSNWVIALTEELLATSKQNENFGPGASVQSKENKEEPRSISDHNDELFPVGTKVQAVYSEDGEWYDATVEAHIPNGYYVRYEEWGNREEVDPANVREIQYDALMEAEKLAEATKLALKRKIAQAGTGDFQSRTVPAKLRVEPGDPEDVKAAKRKKIHAFKSKVRIEQQENAQNKRTNSWQQFQSTKGKTKKIGFFSGRKRESIFKSPDDPHGKVGVTGSGKGLTEFQKRENNLHLKAGNIESDD
ncbi:hypothetical protein ACFE04_023767 [Oxalis oulophora]